MQGMSMASIKKHPSLIPLYVCLGAGTLLATYYTIRLATRNPDVAWGKDKNSNEYYKTKQYKYINHRGIDWNTYQCPAPEYKD